jgi:hypothetical protein
MLIADTGPVTERLRVREIDDDEGPRLVQIVRRGSGSVVTWRRAQMVLLSAQGMDVRANRCIRGTRAAAGRSSRWRSGGRSRRSRSPAQPSMTCRFPSVVHRWSMRFVGAR